MQQRDLYSCTPYLQRRGIATIDAELRNTTQIRSILSNLKSSLDLVVVSNTSAIVSGLVDELSNLGVPVLGTNKESSILESSKVFSKSFFKKYGIPTAEYRSFSSPKEAKEYAESNPFKSGIFVKADGLL
jgi:phosphoribosylamine-glycine ligase